MDPDTRKKVARVLKKGMQHEIAVNYFNEPVDAEGLGIPEYREIIKVKTPLTRNERAFSSDFH